MSLKKKAAKGLTWQVAALGIQAVINIIFIMVLGRLVAPESFGSVALLTVFLTFIEKFTEFGFGAALIQRKTYNEKHVSFAFYTTLLVSSIVYLVIFLVAPWISGYFDSKFSTLSLRVISSLLILKSLGVVSRSLLIREMEFKKLFFAIVISNVIGNLIVGITLGVLGYEIWALIIALICTHGLASIIVFILKGHSLKMYFDKKERNDILHFGTGLTLLRVFNIMGMQIDKLIIGKFFPLSTLGMYERSQFVINLPKVYLGKSLDSVMFSTLSKVQDDIPKIQNFFYRFMSVISLMMVVIAMVLFFYPKEVIMAFLGPKWEDAAPILRIFAAFAYIQMFIRFSDTLVRAKNALYKSSIIKLIFAVIVFGLVMLALPYGITGISYAMVIAITIHAIMMIHLCIKLIDSNWVAFLKILIPSIKLAAILIVKNVALLAIFKSIGLENIFLTLLIALVLDGIILLALLFVSPAIYGKKNINFALNLAENLPGVSKFTKSNAVQRIKSKL